MCICDVELKIRGLYMLKCVCAIRKRMIRGAVAKRGSNEQQGRLPLLLLSYRVSKARDTGRQLRISDCKFFFSPPPNWTVYWIFDQSGWNRITLDLAQIIEKLYLKQQPNYQSEGKDDVLKVLDRKVLYNFYVSLTNKFRVLMLFLSCQIL